MTIPDTLFPNIDEKKETLMLAPNFNFLHSITFIMLLSATCSLQAEDWTQWHGTNRDAKSVEKGLKFPTGEQAPKLDYMTEGFGKGFAGVSVVKGKIYTVGNQGEDGQAVVAADAKTGKIIWKSPITQLNPKHSYPGSRCTPTYDNGKLFVVASSGKIVCLDAADGKIIWEKDFASEWNGKMMSGWGYSESPLVDGDTVLCTPGGPDAMIVCLDKASGKEIWRSAVPAADDKEGKPGAGYSSIVISHGAGVKQYVQLVGQGIVGVRASDGKYLWGYTQVANRVANIPTPVIDGDYVFSTSSYGGGGAVLLKLKKSGSGVDAEEVYWLEKRTFNNHHGGVVLVDGYLYGGHNQNKGFPTCIEMKTGKIVWGGNGLRGEGKGSAAVLYVDGKLIFRYEDGLVVILEATPKEYRVLGKFEPEYQKGKSWAHPVISNGKLYLREQDKLMRYDLKG